jgi:hypothetical protein
MRASPSEYDRRLVPPALQPLGAELRERLGRAVRAIVARRRANHHELLESTRRDHTIDWRAAIRTSIRSTSCRLNCLRRLRERDDRSARGGVMIHG